MNTTLRHFILATFVLTITSCSNDDFDVNDPDVRQFVRMVKDGTYSQKAGFQLPHFNMNDIGQLMQYVGDTTEISEFPPNPISSKVTFPKRLNECIIWTIDGIRLESRFPSLEPCLVDTGMHSDESGYRRLTNKELIDVSKSFLNWHTEYMKQPSDLLRKADLLKNTSYKWY